MLPPLNFQHLAAILIREYERLEYLKWFRQSRCHDGMWDDLQ